MNKTKEAKVRREVEMKDWNEESGFSYSTITDNEILEMTVHELHYKSDSYESFLEFDRMSSGNCDDIKITIRWYIIEDDGNEVLYGEMSRWLSDFSYFPKTEAGEFVRVGMVVPFKCLWDGNGEGKELLLSGAISPDDYNIVGFEIVDEKIDIKTIEETDEEDLDLFDILVRITDIF